MVEAQIGRNRWFTALIAVVALASAAVVAFIVAGVADSFVVGMLLIGLIAAFCVVVWVVFERAAPARTGARPVSDVPAERRLLSTVSELASRFGMASPRVLVMDQPVPNAFAVGSGARATVVYSTCLLELLDDDELEAVCAHELSHIANHDSKVAVFGASLLLWARFMLGLAVAAAHFIMAFGRGFMRSTREDADDAVGGILRLAFGLAFLVMATMVYVFGQVWFFVAKLADLGMCRQREWMADATAVSVTGNPIALASALEKLEQADTGLIRGGQLVQDLCLVGESGHGYWWNDLFQTHPNTVRRIQRLRGFAYPGDPARTELVAGETPDGVPAPPATSAAAGAGPATRGGSRRRRATVGLVVTVLGIAVSAVLASWILAAASRDAPSDTNDAAIGDTPRPEAPPVPVSQSSSSAGSVSETPYPATETSHVPGPTVTVTARGPSEPSPAEGRTPFPASTQPTLRTKAPPRITRTETYREGALVYFAVFFSDPDNDAEGFGFRGVNGSGWAAESHPFSNPSYGRVFPGRVEYPFNHGCGTASETESDVEAWIYDSAGHRSPPAAVHLSCTAPSR